MFDKNYILEIVEHSENVDFPLLLDALQCDIDGLPPGGGFASK